MSTKIAGLKQGLDTILPKTLARAIHLTDSRTVQNAVTDDEAKISRNANMITPLQSKVVDLQKEHKANPNLLDNWDFTNPVNQLSEINYGSSYWNKICIDRWYQYGANNVEVASGGINISVVGVDANIIRQVNESYLINAIKGTTVTISVLSTFESNNGDRVMLYPEGTGGESFLTITGNFATKTITIGNDLSVNAFTLTYLGSNTRTFKVVAIKLEKGTQQTLAHQENGVWVLNEHANYSEELLKCQRYYHLYMLSSKRPRYAMDCVPHMRIDPTQSTLTRKVDDANFNGVNNTCDLLNVVGSGQHITVTQSANASDWVAVVCKEFVLASNSTTANRKTYTVTVSSAIPSNCRLYFYSVNRGADVTYFQNTAAGATKTFIGNQSANETIQIGFGVFSGSASGVKFDGDVTITTDYYVNDANL